MKIFVLTFLLLPLGLFAQTQTPKINIETARKDLLAHNHSIPDNIIREMKPGMFKMMYAGDLCFVHLQYKYYAGEPSMQQSDLIIYRLSDNKWTFENTTSAWYNIDLIDPNNLIFLANVDFCEPNGSCQTYRSVSHYDGKELFMLREYRGYNKKIYCQNMATQGKLNDLKELVGDTINYSLDLSNFMFEQHQTSFTLTRFAESLQSATKTGIKTKKILDNFERVIVNH